MGEDIQELADQLGIGTEDLHEVVDMANQIVEKEGIHLEVSGGLLFLSDEETGTLHMVEDIEPVKRIIQQALEGGK